MFGIYDFICDWWLENIFDDNSTRWSKKKDEAVLFKDVDTAREVIARIIPETHFQYLEVISTNV